MGETGSSSCLLPHHNCPTTLKKGHPIRVAQSVLRSSTQVTEDRGNSPHGFLRLRIAISILKEVYVVMLSP